MSNKGEFLLRCCRGIHQGASKRKELHWVGCLESHKNKGSHYHLTVKLVNFSDFHQNYYTELKYIFKKDTNIFLSSNHPNLQEISSPKTSKCLSALRRKLVHSSHSIRNRAEQEGKTGPSKIKRLSNYDIYKFITGNNIQTADKFFCVARIQKDSDKKDLANYLLSRSQKPISDLFDAAKRMDAATSTMKKNQMSRIEILEEAFLKECICSREWFQCATQVLVSNGIHRFVFDDCICKFAHQWEGEISKHNYHWSCKLWKYILAKTT